MPDYRSALTSGASGAALGFTVGGPIGAGAGALAGILSGIFSDDPNDVREARKQNLLKKIAEMRMKAINEGTTRIAQQTAANARSSAAAAGRRAMAKGVTDVESYTVPAEQQAQAAGGEAMGGFITNTNRIYDQAQLNAETEAANMPIPESLADTVLKVGQSAVDFKLALDRQKLLDRYNGAMPGGQGNMTNAGPRMIFGQTDLNSPSAVDAVGFVNNANPTVDRIRSGMQGGGLAMPGFDDRQVDASTRNLLGAYRRSRMVQE